MTEALWEQEKDDVFNVVADIDSPSAQIQYAFNAGVLAALAAERARDDAAERALREYAVLHYTTRDDGLAIRCLECQAERGLASFSESRHLDHKPSCILQAADQRGGEVGE